MPLEAVKAAFELVHAQVVKGETEVDAPGHAEQPVATVVEASMPVVATEYVLLEQGVQTTLAVLVPTEAR